MALSAPEPLAGRHQTGDFSSGVVTLDEWLKRRALANQASGASRTFVVCEADKIVGYCALAAGAVTTEASSGRFRRNMPDPIPVAVLARLAVDRSYQARAWVARYSATAPNVLCEPPRLLESAAFSSMPSLIKPRSSTPLLDSNRHHSNR